MAFSLAILFYASWSDYKTREVSNRVWAIYAPVALILSLASFLLYAPSELPWFALCFGITAAFSLLLFYSGAFGGADSKALMCMALALPFFPRILLSPILLRGLSPLSQRLFPITILSNAVLFAAATGIYMIIRNVGWSIKNKKGLFEGTLAQESIGKKLAVFITGYRTSITKLKEKWHVYPMEDIEEGDQNSVPKRKLIIVPNDEKRNDVVERLSKAAQEGKITDNVWATPGLPMLIFITAGLIIALLLGDVVWILVSLALG